MRLLIATGNRHKLEEFRRILAPLGIEAVSPAEMGDSLGDVEETGATFAENARIKASVLAERTRMGVAADDSGLCVDALDGRPGVHSARYMGEDTPHSEKIAGLLRELEGIPMERRTARFVSAICCILPDGAVIECEGVCEGAIALQPQGGGGFGYDPVFLYGGATYGELPPEQKDESSHRGRALRALAARLEEHMGKNNKETME